MRGSANARTGDVLFHNKDAPLNPLAHPLLRMAIEVVQTYMAELVQDRDYGRVAAFDDIEVVLVYRVEGKRELFLELRGSGGCSRDVVASRYIGR